MPLALLSALANRNLDNSISPLAANGTTHHDSGLHVICAWPVSGQYGPGSRFLYYGLVAACVFARRIDWLRGACLAGALIIPAVSALHGITLAIMHVPGAVDMDIYGAFQACCIGILAAPITVKLSKTYFNDPGRNTIFLWTILIFSGLVCLTVEFYRVTPTRCDMFDSQNIPINATTFPYQDGSMCNLTCSAEGGIPYSSMRTDAVNNVYVIPVPGLLTPGTATLMAAACCIPAILLLVSMWNTILEKNWQSRFGRQDEGLDDVIEGTNDATLRKMRLVNKRIGSFLALVEALVFGGAVLAVVVIGEINFWSGPVSWQTEPMRSYGQWGPLVGAALAALGSFYVLWISDREPANSKPSSVIHHCDCADHHHSPLQTPRDSGDSRDTQIIDHDVFESPMNYSAPFPNVEQTTSRPPMEQIRRGVTLPTRTHSSKAHDAKERPESFSSERGRSPGASPTSDRNTPPQDAGGRLKIAAKLAKLSEKLGTAERGLFDDSDFREGQATKWPSVPGEEFRNPGLQKTEVLYQQTLVVERTERRSRSRAPSFVGSVASGIDDDGDMHTRSVSPGPSRSHSKRSSQTMGHSPRSPNRSSTSPTSPSSPGMPERRATLEVPGSRVPTYHSMRHSSSPTTGAWFIAVSEVEPMEQTPISPTSPISPPAIFVSEDPDSLSVTDVPAGSSSTSKPDSSPV